MEVTNKKINLEIINDSRGVLLGIATILVTLFHSDLLNFYEIINIKFMANFLNFIQKTGNLGVDIFLCLSGIGLYFSLSKNSLKQYYKNRFIRIIPEFVIVTFIFNLITKSMTTIELLETFFLIAFFVHGVLDIWYIPFIIVLYLIFPIIYKIIKKYDLSAIFCMLLFAVIFNLLYSIIFPISYQKIEIALTRLPVFLIGSFLGKTIYDKKTISNKLIFISFLLQMIISIILYTNLDIPNFSIFARYLYCPLAITIIINSSYLCSFVKNKGKILLTPIKFIGNHSLEIYLIYINVRDIIKINYQYSTYLELYLISFFITIILSYILKTLLNLLTKQLNKTNKTIKC